MKITLTILSLALSGCIASPAENIQKRSVIGDGWNGGYSSASLVAPSISTLSYTPSISSYSVGAPTISSHTHTTSYIDRPVPVAVHTPSISTHSILPSTYSSYNYGLNAYPSYGYPVAASYPSINYNKFYPSHGKYYSRSYPTVYKKSYYSSPSFKSYKWWWFNTFSLFINLS